MEPMESWNPAVASERSRRLKKTLILILAVTLALFALVIGLLAQGKPDVTGAWTGYAIVGDSRLDFQAVITKDGGDYAGRISFPSGIMPDLELRNIALKDNLFTFELDWSDGMSSEVIRIELTLEGDTLRGAWFNTTGESNLVELDRNK